MTPKPRPPEQITTPPTSIGINEGDGSALPKDPPANFAIYERRSHERRSPRTDRHTGWLKRLIHWTKQR